MSCCPPPCQPVAFCLPERFGDAFPSLIGPQGPPGGPGTYVNSLALLRLIDATVWPSGYQAVVGGYAAVNDGGGGTFVYVASGTDADNDGTIIEPLNGYGRWYRIYSGAVSVEWFGAVGDGDSDDSQAIQNAITFVEGLAAGGAVFLPASTYLIESPLTITGAKSFIMYGEGWGSIIKTSGAINCLNMGSGDADQTVLLRLLNFSINGDGACPIGVSNSRLHQTVMSGLYITGTTVAAIDMNLAYDNQISNCTIINNTGHGIIADENNENLRIYDCRFESNTSIAVHFRNGSCSGSKIVNNQFIANGVGIQIDAGAAEVAQSFGVIGNYFKDQEGANCLFGTDTSSLTVDSLLFQNNMIKAGAAGPATCTVEFDRCNNPVLIGNTFTQCDVLTSANVVGLFDLGSTYVTSAVPTEVLFGNSSGNLAAVLPTVDPAVPNELWSDGDVVTVSS